MPARRTLTMRQLRRIMRMHHDGASAREIARSVGMARSTVQDVLKRASAAKLCKRSPGPTLRVRCVAPIFLP